MSRVSLLPLVGAIVGVLATGDVAGGQATATYVAAVVDRDVQVARVDGVARVRERVTLENRGPVAAGGSFAVTLADGAAVTDATLEAGGTTTLAQVLPSEVAFERFTDLSAAGTAAPRPIAQVRVAGRHARVDMALVAPGSRVVVVLESVAPIVRAGDHDLLGLPCGAATRLDVTDASGRVIDGRAVGRLGEHLLARGPSGADDDLALLEAFPRPVSADDADSFDAADDPDGEPGAVDGDSASDTCLVRWPSPLIEGVAARWAWLPLAGGSGIAWLELSVAEAIEAAPRELHVVFVIDASRSEGEDGVSAQVELVRAIASHLPAARIAVVASSRRARLVTRGFVGVDRLGHALAAGAPALVPENGSDVTAGLRAASALLEGRRGGTRIVLMTDREQPLAARPEAALAAIAAAPPQTVVHVVERGASVGEVEVRRLDRELADDDDDDDDDDDTDADADAAAAADAADDTDFGPLVRRTGGMLLRVRGGAGAAHGQDQAARAEARVALRAAARELAVPMHLEGFRIAFSHDVGWQVVAEQLANAASKGTGAAISEPRFTRTGEPATIAGGRLGAAAAHMGRTPGSVELRARIWGRRIHMVVPFDEALRRALPALVIGRGELDDPVDARASAVLDEALVLFIGRTHRIVSAVTSFLLAPRAAAPSVDGEVEPRRWISLSGISSSSCGHWPVRRGVMSIRGVGVVVAPELELARGLARPLAACVARHGPLPSAAALQVETTSIEILGVTVRGIGGPLARCVEAASWLVDAPPSMPEHGRLTLQLADVDLAPIKPPAR